MLPLSSSIVGRDFEAYVHLPGNYQDTSRRYPLIIVLDAQWDFTLVTSIYGQQYYDGFVPASIVVGVTWGGQNPRHDSLRARDLTPTHNKRVPQSGNAEKFLAFITSELIPMIDARYRTNRTDRTLMGSSYGGLFTLYAMFRETSVFNRYVLTSPAVGWDGGVLSSFQKEYAARRADIPIRVFMAEGALETGVAEFKKFVADLEDEHFRGMRLQSRMIEGAGHSGAKAEGFTRGLQSVFERPSLTLAPETLKMYEGTYEVNPDMELKFTVEEGVLVAHAPGNVKVILHAATERDFYVRGMLSEVRFEKDASGKVSGFLWRQYSGDQFVRKIR